MQARQFYCLIQTVHYIIRQKRGDQIHCNVFCLMSLQITHLVAIHVIPYGRITHTVEFHICIRIAVLEFLVSLLHAHGTQGIHIFLRDLPVTLKAVLHIGSDGTQHTACSCDTYFRKFSAQIRFQLFLYLGNSLSHLADVMDLSVQHGSGLMLLGALCQHMELPAI